MTYVPNSSDWPHQTYAVTETLRLINEGEKAICVTSPTGAGKSRVMQRFCEYDVSQGLTSVVMSNRILLTNQLLKGLDKAGIRVGCRAAGFDSWTDLDAPVQVISAQTEIARVMKRRANTGRDIQLHPAQRLYIDEAHLQGGDDVKAVIDEYATKYGATIIGITATPLGISHIYKSLVIAGNNSQLRACGALVPARCYEPAVIDLPKVRRSKTGVFSQASMDREMRSIWSQHIVGNVIDQWKKRNPDCRPSLGMAPGVAEARGMAKAYWEMGINAASIDAEGIFVNGEYKRTNEQEDRDELFAMAKDGRVPVIWNRYVLREAIDLPWLYMLSLACPIASLTSYLQVVGRVMRSSPGKDHALVCDHCGVMRMHGSPNADRDEDWRRYFFEKETKITVDAHNKKVNPNNNEPEPITCPRCQMIRKAGVKCPGCQFEHQKSTRMVIQENGDLKPVTGVLYPKRVTQEKPDTFKHWESIYFSHLNRGRTFSQARAWFFHEHRYWPPYDLPLMPRDSMDLTRKIGTVAPSELYERDS